MSAQLVNTHNKLPAHHRADPAPLTMPCHAKLEALANRFKILGDSTRLQILATLCQSEQNVQGICRLTGLQQANVSKHLRILKDAQIVTCRRESSFRYYRLLDQACTDLCWRAKELPWPNNPPPLPQH